MDDRWGVALEGRVLDDQQVAPGRERSPVPEYLCESFDMVGRLPRALLATGGGLVGNACLESFLVHVRLLSAFLVRRPQGPDVGPLDVLWPGPASDAAARLATRWEPEASHQVLHLGRRRIPDQPEADDELGGPARSVAVVVDRMREMAQDVFEVADAFVRALEGYGHPDAAALRRSLDFNRQALLSTPSRAMSP